MNLQAAVATITAKIDQVHYQPFLCPKNFSIFAIEELELALSKGTFILKGDDTLPMQFSRWVSPKRTRSYPFARVYDCLSSSLRKVTIIPIVKDEGIDGDRDFLQWDTVSWMSLLDVHVIIATYSSASKSKRYASKITDQILDIKHLRTQLASLHKFKASAVQWNLLQLEHFEVVGRRALDSYAKISTELDIEMHSYDSGLRRIVGTSQEAADFKEVSRNLARRAQLSESVTVHAAEESTWNKGRLDIRNHLGGIYHLTVDQIVIKGSTLELIEVKHSKSGLPSTSDIKDALVKLALLTNLEEVSIGSTSYSVVPKLKLTTNEPVDFRTLRSPQRVFFETLLNEESVKNNFSVEICHIGSER